LGKRLVSSMQNMVDDAPAEAVGSKRRRTSSMALAEGEKPDN
jgi:hypothetical protein